MTSRRNFVLSAIPATVLALSASRMTFAQAERLEESSPAASALGYKHDASKVDVKKYAQYVAGHNCANCQLYAGKATDPWAGCGAMGGKQVNAKGWCIVWAKKA